MKGDSMEKIFLAAYELHADAIFRYCYFKTHDRELAKDLLQQTFLKTWEYVCTGKEIENWRPFLYRLAGNLVIDWYRRKKTESLDALIEKGFDLGDQAMESSLAAEVGLALRALDKLPAGDQDLVAWRYLEELSPKEIAVITGDSENNTAVKLHRAIRRLRALLQ